MSRSLRNIALIVILLIGIQNTCLAGAYKDFGKLWQQSGGMVATTSPQSYKGQQGGHYTLGSMYFARERKSRPLISVTLPEIDIDTTCFEKGVVSMGGLSVISSKEFVGQVQKALPLAGMMLLYQGVKSLSPVLGSTLEEVYSKLQELGGILADSCKMAQGITAAAGDVLTNHSTAAQSIASRFGIGSGNSSDLASAYKDYSKNKAKSLEAAASKDERFLLEDVNLAWKALEKLKLKDIEVKKIMMSLSGTIIIKASKDGKGDPSFQYISSNITNSELLKALLKGGSDLPVLECSGDQKKCLSVKPGTQTIRRQDSFEYKVSEYFLKFKQALQDDVDLSEGNSDVHSFLTSSGLPVYRIYDVMYQYTNANPEYEQGALIEIVAWNILYNYLSDALTQVSEATNNLQIAAAPQLKDFKESILKTRKLLSDLSQDNLARHRTQLALVGRAENYEKAIASDISRIFSMERS